jgi:hypothetical protein
MGIPHKNLDNKNSVRYRWKTDYYEARGWDKKSGNPIRAKLGSFGLKSVADDLEKLDKLP